jgi:hypothetical protein
MAFLERNYKLRCDKTSDINEHLPTLYEYAKECTHITECGVRDAVSSYAFAYGLVGKANNKIIQIDPEKTDHIDDFQYTCGLYDVNTIFYEVSDLESPMEETDLLFIDTWHIYGQLKRELNRWHSYVKKYILLHDTTVDAWEGEAIRLSHDLEKSIKMSGFPIEEITRGLWPAVEEFLEQHPEWTLHKRYMNNNGLTILRRV